MLKKRAHVRVTRKLPQNHDIEISTRGARAPVNLNENPDSSSQAQKQCCFLARLYAGDKRALLHLHKKQVRNQVLAGWEAKSSLVCDE